MEFITDLICSNYEMYLIGYNLRMTSDDGVLKPEVGRSDHLVPRVRLKG